MRHLARTLFLIPLLVVVANPDGTRRAAVLEDLPVSPPQGSASEFSCVPAGDRIAWRLDLAGGGLWVCDRNGANRVQVASDTESEQVHVLALSPNGQHVAYARTTHEAPPSIIGVGVIEVASRRKIELPGTSVAWTRKGDRVAIADPARGTITVVEAASFKSRVLAKTSCSVNPNEELRMAWSPDASKLAYATRQEEAPTTSLWVAALSGGDPRLVASDEEGCVSLSPFWSPDGRLTWRWTGSKEPATTRHFVQEANGKVAEIGKGLPLDPEGQSVWSPDGKAIVFPRTVAPENGDGPSMTDLWEMDARTGELRRLTESGDAFGEVVWAPSGNALFLQETGRLRYARTGAR